MKISKHINATLIIVAVAVCIYGLIFETNIYFNPFGLNAAQLLSVVAILSALLATSIFIVNGKIPTDLRELVVAIPTTNSIAAILVLISGLFQDLSFMFIISICLMFVEGVLIKNK